MAIYLTKAPIPHAGLIRDPDGQYGAAVTAEYILVPEEIGRYSGLLDAQGNPLYHFPEPIGFRLRRN